MPRACFERGGERMCDGEGSRGKPRVRTRAASRRPAAHWRCAVDVVERVDRGDVGCTSAAARAPAAGADRRRRARRRDGSRHAAAAVSPPEHHPIPPRPISRTAIRPMVAPATRAVSSAGVASAASASAGGDSRNVSSPVRGQQRRHFRAHVVRRRHGRHTGRVGAGSASALEEFAHCLPALGRHLRRRPRPAPLAARASVQCRFTWRDESITSAVCPR
jgi:hypothetical protein